MTFWTCSNPAVSRPSSSCSSVYRCPVHSFHFHHTLGTLPSLPSYRPQCRGCGICLQASAPCCIGDAAWLSIQRVQAVQTFMQGVMCSTCIVHGATWQATEQDLVEAWSPHMQHELRGAS